MCWLMCESGKGEGRRRNRAMTRRARITLSLRNGQWDSFYSQTIIDPPTQDNVIRPRSRRAQAVLSLLSRCRDQNTLCQIVGLLLKFTACFLRLGPIPALEIQGQCAR